MAYTLSDRPPLRMVSWLKWLAIAAFVLAIVFIIAGLIAGYMYMEIPSEDESALEALYGALSTTLENAGYYLISTGFFGLILWMASIAVDRLDQLVWLNASDEDRAEIIAKRKKKRVKSDERNTTVSKASSAEVV